MSSARYSAYGRDTRDTRDTRDKRVVKSPVSSRPSSKKKAKKTNSQKQILSSDREDETMMNLLSIYNERLNLDEPVVKKSSPMREESSERMQMMKMQLHEALEENAFVKSRLNAELKERHILESKQKDMTRKFAESRKALQATGAALLQVHTQTSELKNKRDEREVLLDEALGINKQLNGRIAELETRLEHALLGNGAASTTTTLKRLIEDKEELISAMEEQQVQLQSHMSKIRRDNYQMGDLNAELQEAVDAKNRKISNLLKKTENLSEELDRLAALTGQPGASTVFEDKLRSFEGEKRFLEQRMSQLELSLKQSESYAQSIRTGPQLQNQSQLVASQPGGERPSNSSPRKSARSSFKGTSSRARTISEAEQDSSSSSPAASPGGMGVRSRSGKIMAVAPITQTPFAQIKKEVSISEPISDFEFPPTETILAKYTEKAVDAMLKPDADADVFKERLLTLRRKVKRDIYAWSKSFVNENNRQPSKEDRKTVSGPMFRAYSGSGKLLKELGVEGIGESAKMNRSSSVKFTVED